VKKTFFLKHQFFIITITTIFWCYLLGFDFINPLNSEWLYLGDLSQYQLGWKFFRDDIWRFPIGSNPNLGMYFEGSIIFSDSIPIFAFFFKSIKIFLPENFQYFSTWILVCIYLQLFFSFKIIYKFTNNLSYSLIGSLFFIFSTIFLNRSGIHLSLMGQWILLSGIYVETINDKSKPLYRVLNILLSVIIHFYFTIILILLYAFIKICDFFKKEINLIGIIKEFFLLIIPVVVLMYIVGYFTIQLDDGLGWGYGYYNFNLNSFFNPSGSNYIESFNWSQFFKQKQYQNGELEGFSYLGIVGIFFFLLFIVNFFLKKNLIIFDRQKLLIISLLFLILATSHNINFGENNIFFISINNLFYALLSSIRASGRLIWPVYYLIFLVGIIFIFKNFKIKRPTLVILMLFFVQIIDINPGLLKYSLGSQYVDGNKKNKLGDKIWNNLSNNFEIIRSLEPENNSEIYNKLSGYLLNENFKKTDIAYLARVNRDSIVKKKYELVKLFNQKDTQIFKKTIFISQNINFVKSLYELYGDTLYYYYKDDFWLISIKPFKGTYINKNYIINSNIYKINLDRLNKIDLSNQKNSVQGMGWEINKKNNNLILNGYFSSLLLNIEGSKCHKNSEITFSIDKYFKSQNEPINLNIVINNSKKELTQIKDKLNNQLTLGFNCKVNENNKIEFNIENPKSLFDLKKGLNRDKRSIILNLLKING
jgi:hypothetical protein